jgi:hypothetical protein
MLDPLYRIRYTWGMSTNYPECETDDTDEACLSCEDTGYVTTPGGWKIPCSDCPTGDMHFQHDRERFLAEMVHEDDLLPGIDEPASP